MTPRAWTGSFPWFRFAIALLIGTLSAPASGQFMGAGADFGAAGMTRIGRKSAENYGKLVGMDESQQEAALALQEGYSESHASMVKKFQDDMKKIQEEFQDTQDWTVFQKKMPKMAMEFGEKMEGLEKEFLADVRALLTPDQDAKWPRVERMRRRETNLRFAMVSGQAVDLIDVLGDLKIDPAASPELTDQIERYELELDKSLVALEKWGKDQQKQWMDDENAFDFTKMQEMMEKAEKMMKDMSDLAKGVRDVNQQYARTIAPLVGADQQSKFDLEVKRRSFPRVYRTPWLSKALGAAAGFEDLSGEQRGSLAELRTAYERELGTVNAKWAAAITARDEKSGGPMMAMVRMGRGDNETDDEVSTARKERRELDDRYKAKLEALLTSDQIARLPEETREKGDDGFMGMMSVDDLEGQESDDEDPS